LATQEIPEQPDEPAKLELLVREDRLETLGTQEQLAERVQEAQLEQQVLVEQ